MLCSTGQPVNTYSIMSSTNEEDKRLYKALKEYMMVMHGEEKGAPLKVYVLINLLFFIRKLHVFVCSFFFTTLVLLGDRRTSKVQARHGLLMQLNHIMKRVNSLVLRSEELIDMEDLKYGMQGYINSCLLQNM